MYFIERGNKVNSKLLVEFFFESASLFPAIPPRFRFFILAPSILYYLTAARVAAGSENETETESEW